MIYKAERQLQAPTLLLPIQFFVEAPAKALRWVIKSQFFVQTIDLLDLLLAELEVTLQVLLNSGFSFALWNNGMAMGNAPCEGDLSTGLVVLLADLDKGLFVHEFAHVLP